MEAFENEQKKKSGYFQSYEYYSGSGYEKFLATMADRKPNRVALHPNAAEFAAELSRFTFQQDKAWDPDFVHRLLF